MGLGVTRVVTSFDARRDWQRHLPGIPRVERSKIFLKNQDFYFTYFFIFFRCGEEDLPLISSQELDGRHVYVYIYTGI